MIYAAFLYNKILFSCNYMDRIRIVDCIWDLIIILVLASTDLLVAIAFPHLFEQ